MTILNRDDRLICAENAVIAFPHLYQPYGKEDKKSWSVESILDPQNPQHQQIRNDILLITADIVQAQGLRNANPELMIPLKDGNQINRDRAAKAKDPRPELTGKWSLYAADGRNPPAVFDQNRQPLPESQGANIFGGCVCHVIFNLYWRKRADNPGVSAGLKIVQLINNAGVERFGGSGIDDKTAQNYLLSVEGAPPALVQGAPSVGPMPTQGPGSPAPWETPQTPDKPDWM